MTVFGNGQLRCYLPSSCYVLRMAYMQEQGTEKENGYNPTCRVLWLDKMSVSSQCVILHNKKY